MRQIPEIGYWAHMLDEAFDKRSDAEKLADTGLPEDENVKFTFGDVFPEGIDLDDAEKTLSTVWPKWRDYLEDKIDRTPAIEVEGQQRDVDDWDLWKIDPIKCFDSVDTMIDIAVELLPESFTLDETVTMKSVVDRLCEILVDNAGEYCDLDRLQDYGQCIYEGHPGRSYYY